MCGTHASTPPPRCAHSRWLSALPARALLAVLALQSLPLSSGGGPRDDTCLPFPSQARHSHVVISWLLLPPHRTPPQPSVLQPDTNSPGRGLALRTDFSRVSGQRENTVKMAWPLAVSAGCPQA